MKKLLFIGIFALGIFTLSEAEYFISPKGSDTNKGTRSKPWVTLSHAAKCIGAGDVVNVGGGIYHETLKPAGDGRDGHHQWSRAGDDTGVVITHYMDKMR